MLLNILIPTYNRYSYLKKNLYELAGHIDCSNLAEKVSIIVSDNCSSDETSTIEETDLAISCKVDFYRQKSNIGLEENALYCLSQAHAEYVMYLGDDDFINREYLERVFHILETEKPGFIVPSFLAVDADGNSLNRGRDLEQQSKKYSAGFWNCYFNSWRAHQLSGTVYRRNDLLESYRRNGVGNIYLFIYFAAVSALKGKTVQVFELPVHVTKADQGKKDWNYGKLGLLDDILNNYKYLGLNPLKRAILEISFITRQPWRVFKHINSWNTMMQFYKLMLRSNNLSLLGKTMIFPVIVLIMIRRYAAIKLTR